MATLSLNGNFNYPIELNQNLIVDENSTFRGAISHGVDNVTNGQHSLACGNMCTTESEFSMAYGYRSYVGYNSNYACANGMACSAYGEGAFAFGYNASTIKNDRVTACKRSFVWQGDDSSESVYHSKGDGTFCINPQYAGTEDKTKVSSTMLPLCGFFIGDTCIAEHISSESAKRIIENENTFSARQTFGEDVEFSNGKNVDFNGIVEFSPEGSVTLSGSTFIPVNNDVDGNIRDDNLAANHRYVNSVAMSSVTTVGQYYPNLEDVTQEFMSTHSSWSIPLSFMESYVTSGINNVDKFIQEGDGLDSAASRDYALTIATSASTYLLKSDNVDSNSFKGKNNFDGNVTFGNCRVSSSPSTILDFTYGTLLVDEPKITDVNKNTVATEIFSRSVATSGVNWIINESNRYNGDNLYKYVGILQNIELTDNATADFVRGKVKIPEPNSSSMKENEPATTSFSRNVALSAVDHLLYYGGTFGNYSSVSFNGNTRFNTNIDLSSPEKAQLKVKTRGIGDSSNYAASTEFVSKTISTSSISVHDLIVGEKQEDISRENNFFTKNLFLNRNIYVSTMEDDCDDNHAASCEWVKNIVGNIQTFDLFDIKFMDYKLPDSSAWKMQGTYIKNKNNEAYKHILSEYIQYRNDPAYQVNNETVPGTTIKISYIRAPDGHRIVSSSDVNIVDSIYQNTGIAWYYVINVNSGTESLRLPSTSYYLKADAPWTFDGISEKDGIKRIGEYVRPSIPSHSHSFSVGLGSDGSHGGLAHHGKNGCSSTGGTTGGANFSNQKPPIDQSSNTIKPPSTQLLLYFYCGKNS